MNGKEDALGDGLNTVETFCSFATSPSFGSDVILLVALSSGRM